MTGRSREGREGREGDDNMLAQGPEQRKTLYTNLVIEAGSLVAFFRAFARLMRMKLIGVGAHSSVEEESWCAIFFPNFS